MQKLPKILTATFLLIFVFQLFCILFIPNISQAYNFQVPLPGSENIQFDGTTKPIGVYISLLYNYAIGVVGILATVVMMVGGIMWIAAAGNTSRIGEAKAWIGAALTGLVLALASYMVLNIINPNLVKFSSTPIPPPEKTKYDFGLCTEKNKMGDICGNENGDSGWCLPKEGEDCLKGCTCDPNFEPHNYVNTCKKLHQPCVDDEGYIGSCEPPLKNKNMLYCRSAYLGCCLYEKDGEDQCRDWVKESCTEENTGVTINNFSYNFECQYSSLALSWVCRPKP